MHVTVWTNDAANPRIKLTACASVKHAIRTEPALGQSEKLAFERSAGDPEQQTATIRLLRGEGKPLRPAVRELGFSKWDASARAFYLEPSPNLTADIEEVEAGQRYDLTITARPPWPARPTHGEIVLATGAPQQPEFSLRFRLDGSARLRAEPATFDYKELRSPAGSRVDLVWSGHRPPGRVVRAEANDPSLIVELLETADGQTVLVKSPELYSPPGRLPRITVYTGDDAIPELRINVASSRASK